ncbi:MAG: hypothetical protein P8P74_07485 [Crocinitomicaceae bacterium]|nr:hypothetical protein [Crocinitomicaceae bacterium]
MATNKRNIWIIAFAFPPNKRVGAMRAGYWCRSFPEALNANVEVITGQEDAAGEKIHVVPKSGSSIWTKIIADDGIIWKKNIQSYLESNSLDQPDLVIITGGPFMHFGLTPWLKKKYGCKVILDYRDPFAINPGFKNSWLKVKIKQFVEKRFNAAADGLITVNEYCGKIISLFDSKPSVIVQNGYDEKVKCEPNDVVMSEDVSFSYAGKFYFDPTPIQEAVNQSEVNLHYIGPDESQLDLDSDFVHSKGFVDYPTALDVIGNCDVGIIQTFGHEFQSTTKIFDYVRCERAILIVSGDKLHEGSIHDELKKYPNVFWAKNDAESISEAITQIKQSTYVKPPAGFADKYSRKYQLTNVVELIDQLLG